MPKLTKDGHTVETDYAPEVVALRSQGFTESAPKAEPKPKPTAN